jgi:hypothetical protein
VKVKLPSLGTRPLAGVKESQPASGVRVQVCGALPEFHTTVLPLSGKAARRCARNGASDTAPGALPA